MTNLVKNHNQVSEKQWDHLVSHFEVVSLQEQPKRKTQFDWGKPRNIELNPITQLDIPAHELQTTHTPSAFNLVDFTYTHINPHVSKIASHRVKSTINKSCVYKIKGPEISNDYLYSYLNTPLDQEYLDLVEQHELDKKRLFITRKTHHTTPEHESPTCYSSLFKNLVAQASPHRAHATTVSDSHKQKHLIQSREHFFETFVDNHNLFRTKDRLVGKRLYPEVTFVPKGTSCNLEFDLLERTKANIKNLQTRGIYRSIKKHEFNLAKELLDDQSYLYQFKDPLFTWRVEEIDSELNTKAKFNNNPFASVNAPDISLEVKNVEAILDSFEEAYFGPMPKSETEINQYLDSHQKENPF